MSETKTFEVNAEVENLFRRVSGQLVATLTRVMGSGQIDLAESVVQEAFLRACEVWTYKGIPENPVGWLTRVAKNHAIDRLRRDRRFEAIAPELLRSYESQIDATLANSILDDAELIDDQLKMMLLACHPILSPKAQVSLTLKTVGGFSVGEIAKCFLSDEEATRRMLSRSKNLIRERNVSFEIPEIGALSDRLDRVLDTLYLIFNEGYAAHKGDSIIRRELCDDAIRLTSLFLKGNLAVTTKQPTIKALLALMLLHSSRSPARTDADGGIVLLEDQDRLLWDRARINAGLKYLGESAEGHEISTYHHEAHIAAVHAMSESYRDTDWRRILGHYDSLIKMSNNPLLKLNRAVAFANVHGFEKGLAELNKSSANGKIGKYYLFPATQADFYRRLGDRPNAALYYKKALGLATNPAEHRFLERRIRETGNR